MQNFGTKKTYQNLEHFYLNLSHVMKYIHKKVSEMDINNIHIHQTKGETFIYFLISNKAKIITASEGEQDCQHVAGLENEVSSEEQFQRLNFSLKYIVVHWF